MTVTDKKNIAIVCNVLAGMGKSEELSDKILEILDLKNIPYSFFKENWPPDFKGFTDVWIIGGDGTLNYFVNHYPDIEIPLVIFKGGSGNDFHWLLYAEMNFETQIQHALVSVPKPVDMGKCNERYFLNGTGIGFEGEVCRGLAGKKKKAGKSSFLVMVVKKIFSYRSKHYRIIVDELSIDSGKYLMIDITNGSRAGGGFHIAPNAKPDDGLFDVILINALHPLKRLRWLPVIEKGKHPGLSFVRYFKTRKIRVKSDSMIQAHLDGEYYEAKTLEIEILPGRILFRY